MMEAILVVLSSPTKGRDDDFNDWYTNIHLRDALGFRGSIAAQRFQLSGKPLAAPQGMTMDPYLALYEVFDAERFAQEHFDNALTKHMRVSDAIDMQRMNDYHYYLLQQRDKNPLARNCSVVLLEQIAVEPEARADFEDWYNNEYLPLAHAMPGVVRSAFLAYDTHGQLMKSRPDYSHVGIYHLEHANAVRNWPLAKLSASPKLAGPGLAVTRWEAITPRYTMDDVAHTSAAWLAAHERAVVRMGDRIISDRGTSLRTD